LSFLDERDERSGRTPPGGPGPRGAGTDRQTLLARRGIALVAAVVVIILMVLGVRSCLDARERRSYEDYIQEVTSLVTESDQQSKALFDLLGGAEEQSSVDVENTVNGFRVEAEQLVERAEATERPDQFQAAQDYLVEALEFRRDGLSAIAERLPTALADEGRGEAAAQIAAQMQNFLASDVIYLQRAIPNLEGPLKEKELAGEVGEIPRSQFLPDIDWLQPVAVSDAGAGLRGDAASSEPATPGLHGTGLEDVAVQPSGQSLVEGETNEIPLRGDVAFDVAVANQGENDESEVPVTISIEGGDEPIELEGELDSIAAGETGTATVPLADTPPTGEELELTVTIEGVPGEEMLENNEGTYPVIFSD
jgi:hypothetical protein